jgi:predicted Rossmann fold nucleotide-binding protein DprA/Smf involved in DNA uptake
MMEIQYLGNQELLKLQKTAFLASNTIPIEMVLKCYDWASGKHEGCVISGFSSKLEKDVLHFLLKSKCPVILVLARRMCKVIPPEMKEPLEQGRILIISTSKAVRQSKQTALERNRYICEISDEIFFVGVTPKSSLYPLKDDYRTKAI